METTTLSLDARMVLNALHYSPKEQFTKRQIMLETHEFVKLPRRQVEKATEELLAAGELRRVSPEVFELARG